MSISYLDSGGLSYFWNKIKSYVTSVIPNVPTNVSAFTNDAGYLTSYTETDPTVPSWAKAASKPTYTASEVGADASGTAASAVSTHNSSSTAHSDIRSAIPTNVSDLNNDAGYTTNVGTITGITMNGSSQGTSGVVDLGTVITAHQDISGKLDKSGGTMTGALTLSGNPTSNLHAATKQYVDSHSGSGDMLKIVYDANNDGMVDKAEAVNNANGVGGIEFGLDANGKGQYRAVGASTWIPFLKEWEVVGVMYGLGSAASNKSYAVLSTRVKEYNADYVADDEASSTLVTIEIQKNGYYNFICFPRGSNNANANFRLVVGGTQVLTMSSIPNAPTTSQVYEYTSSRPLAQGEWVHIEARNASTSSAAHSCGVIIIYLGETIS